MNFPINKYPYLHELDRLEKLGLREESYNFRKEYKELLWKEHNKRLYLIEYRQVNLGGNNNIHKRHDRNEM